MQHLTKKQKNHYSFYHVGEPMFRMYMRAKDGARKMIPNGWWCPSCKKHYTDSDVEKGSTYGKRKKPIFNEC